MSTIATLFPGRLPAALPAMPPRPTAAVFLPKEHGSWSLALEPLALGLLVAPSWAGGALAMAAVAGFFARRPLKAAFDRASPARRDAARFALALLALVAAVALVELLVFARWGAFWPLVPAAGLGAAFAWFDAQGESRAAASEVAGSAAFALLPAAFATLAGLSAGAALGLAGLALARSVPAVLVVRTCLRRAKGAPALRTIPLFAAAVSLVAVVSLAAQDLVPATAAVLGTILFARALWLLGPWAPGWPAKRLGMMEGLLGLIYVGLIAAAYAG